MARKDTGAKNVHREKNPTRQVWILPLRQCKPSQQNRLTRWAYRQSDYYKGLRLGTDHPTLKFQKNRKMNSAIYLSVCLLGTLSFGFHWRKQDNIQTACEPWPSYVVYSWAIFGQVQFCVSTVFIGSKILMARWWFLSMLEWLSMGMTGGRDWEHAVVSGGTLLGNVLWLTWKWHAVQHIWLHYDILGGGCWNVFGWDFQWDREWHKAMHSGWSPERKQMGFKIPGVSASHPDPRICLSIRCESWLHILDKPGWNGRMSICVVLDLHLVWRNLVWNPILWIHHAGPNVFDSVKHWEVLRCKA